jgi:hypothetical protein
VHQRHPRLAPRLSSRRSDGPLSPLPVAAGSRSLISVRAYNGDPPCGQRRGGVLSVEADPQSQRRRNEATRLDRLSVRSISQSPPWTSLPPQPNFSRKPLPRVGPSLATRRSTPKIHDCANRFELLRPTGGYGEYTVTPDRSGAYAGFATLPRSFFWVFIEKGGLEIDQVESPNGSRGESVTQRDKP